VGIVVTAHQIASEVGDVGVGAGPLDIEHG
jgi:hypothetical protein